jgi:hypothetical protein
MMISAEVPLRRGCKAQKWHITARFGDIISLFSKKVAKTFGSFKIKHYLCTAFENNALVNSEPR